MKYYFSAFLSGQKVKKGSQSEPIMSISSESDKVKSDFVLWHQFDTPSPSGTALVDQLNSFLV